MREYIRRYVPGGTFFFTVVTHQRKPFLLHTSARQLLHKAIADVRAERAFEIVAWVLLPQHFHTVWTLPPDESDYSMRMQQIKGRFTKAWIELAGSNGYVRPARRQRTVWQPRFWEHTCKDELDLKRHVDYMHVEPGQARSGFKSHRLPVFHVPEVPGPR